MKDDCSTYRERLVSLAAGEPDEAALAHSKTCAGCGQKLAEIRRIIDAASLKMFEAPRAAVRAAQELMPSSAGQISLARLVRTTLQMAGVRSASAEAFQNQYEADGLRARIMYRPEGSSWQVLGRLDPPHWQVEVEGRNVEVSSAGEFSFRAQSLSRTAVSLTSGDRLVQIPDAQSQVADEF